MRTLPITLLRVAWGVCLSSAWSSGASAAQTQLQSFILVEDESGSEACIDLEAAQESLSALVETALDSAGLDPHFAVVLTAQSPGCSSIFYVPLKNDVRGIGYQHGATGELFDKAAGRNLEGIVFLNDLPYWRQYPEELASQFLHELGHRWLARVHAQVNGEELPILGRENSHWSYYFDSEGSPDEGNTFTPASSASDAQSRRYQTTTPGYAAAYSDLDLYLMGAESIDPLKPLRLLVPDQQELSDCLGDTLSRVSPPQFCGQQSILGKMRLFSVASILEAEGARVPDAAGSPHEHDLSFLVLRKKSEDFSLEACQFVEEQAPQLTQVYSRATSGRMSLRLLRAGKKSCSELELLTDAELESEEAKSGGCSLAPTAAKTQPGWPLLLGTLFALLVRRRDRRRVST